MRRAQKHASCPSVPALDSNPAVEQIFAIVDGEGRQTASVFVASQLVTLGAGFRASALASARLATGDAANQPPIG
jgi:hypothetical protein